MSTTDDSTDAVRSETLSRIRRLRAMSRHPGFVIGLLIVGVVFLVAVTAPLIAPYSPYAQNLDMRTAPPVFLGGTWAHPLGTDLLGRDYLSRLIYGARIALLIAFGAIAMSSLIGITLGLLAGFYGGRVDMVVMFLITVRLSLPVVLVALAVVGLVGRELHIIMAVLASFLWERFAVVTRALVMQLRERDFVLAARSVGASNLRIMVCEILPNLVAPLVIVATLEMVNAVLLEAALSFLGLGVKPPAASWGLMIAEAKDFVFFEPWLINVPGIALFVLVIGINLLGDGLQDLFSGKARSKR